MEEDKATKKKVDKDNNKTGSNFRDERWPVKSTCDSGWTVKVVSFWHSTQRRDTMERSYPV